MKIGQGELWKNGKTFIVVAQSSFLRSAGKSEHCNGLLPWFVPGKTLTSETFDA